VVCFSGALLHSLLPLLSIFLFLISVRIYGSHQYPWKPVC